MHIHIYTCIYIYIYIYKRAYIYTCIFCTSSTKTTVISGGVKDYNFLAACVNLDINYIFGILTSRAID